MGELEGPLGFNRKVAPEGDRVLDLPPEVR
jgi:hypothetical protein